MPSCTQPTPYDNAVLFGSSVNRACFFIPYSPPFDLTGIVRRKLKCEWLEQLFGAFDPAQVEVLVWRQPRCQSELPDEVRGAELDRGGQLRDGYVLLEVRANNALVR